MTPNAESGQRHLLEGARNLLVNCAGVRAGQRLLIVREDPQLGWYDAAAPAAVADLAAEMGLQVTLADVGGPENEPDAGLDAQILATDVAVFFARLGDQDRFSDRYPGTISVMSYARDAEMLSSRYGRSDHRAFLDLKDTIDGMLSRARSIEITCPLGSHLAGSAPQGTHDDYRDVRIKRFPLGVPHPVSAAAFSGRIAIAGYLTSTGSKIYHPSSVQVPEPVFAEIRSGRIMNFSGDPCAVKTVSGHHEFVSGTFQIEGDVVHSWHAGIHPACFYRDPISKNPDRWSNNVFTHPRFLHFHTCGNYAPGEICWMIKDPSVSLDGILLWENGTLKPERFSDTARCLERWPIVRELLEQPSQTIGI